MPSTGGGGLKTASIKPNDILGKATEKGNFNGHMNADYIQGTNYLIIIL